MAAHAEFFIWDEMNLTIRVGSHFGIDHAYAGAAEVQIKFQMRFK
jgi:hypothetical protein